MEIADGCATRTCHPRGTSVGDLPASTVSALQLIPATLGSARTPPLGKGSGGRCPSNASSGGGQSQGQIYVADEAHKRCAAIP